MSQKKTLREILDDWKVYNGTLAEDGSLYCDLRDWHRAALTKYGEQVREKCLDLVRKQPYQVLLAHVASDMNAIPLPPIEEGEATR
jgi:hypothetical protein